MVKRRIIDCSDRPLFITTNTRDRLPIFSNPAFAQEAIDQIYRAQLLHPFFLFGFVIMPDHCHFLLNVPSPGTISQIMNTYKSGLAHQIGQGLCGSRVMICVFQMTHGKY
ncbi:MAG: transposase [Candidatus Peribacteraceae bacterium]|nr:transposase [Candidatus Peribacteraceae bacterium]